MQNPPSKLPQLPQTFRVGEALAAGVGKGALRSSALMAPYHGVRSVVTEHTASSSASERMLRAARLFLPRLRPGEAISHTSALLIYGCPLRISPDLHVTSQPTHSRSRVRGVQGHEWKVSTPIAHIDGVPLARPSTAVLQAGSRLSLLALIVAIDHLRLRRGFDGRLPPLLNIDDLIEETRSTRGRGIKRVLLALNLSRDGAESRMETLTRLLLLAYGLDTYFEAQVEIFDDNGVIGRFDFVDIRRTTIVEFDGDQHRTDRAQYEKDLRRLDRARAAGYRVIRLLSTDVVYQPRQTAVQVAAALGVEIRPHPRREELLANPFA